MAVFSLQASTVATSFDFDAGGNFVTEEVFSQVALRFSIPDSASFGFSYSAGTPGNQLIDFDDENTAFSIEVTLDTPLQWAEMDVPDTVQEPLIDHTINLAVTRFFVFDVVWNSGANRTTVGIMSELYPGIPAPADTDTWFELGGDALPTFTSEIAFGSFLESDGNSLFTAIDSAPGGAGQSIPLASFATFVTDVDDIVDTTGLGSSLSTGLGNDTIAGLQGGDIINGGAGFDTVRYDLDAEFDGNNSSMQADLIAGTIRDGFGEIDQVSNIERIIGTAAGDSVISGSADIEFVGGDGDDTMFAGSGKVYFEGGIGYDTLSYDSDTAGIFVDYSRTLVKGSEAGRDTFDSVERVIGGSGNDFIISRDGANLWFEGNEGNDIVKFKAAAFGEMYGGSGNDKLVGAAGVDSLWGGGDNDVLFGFGGEDTLDGADGRDYLYGGRGHDDLFGGAGNDFLRGNIGNDTLLGGEGNDDLEGGNGNDTLEGEDGNDILEGNAGRDDLTGGSGDDYFYGGTQADVFRFSARSGVENDRIQDFEDGLDRIYLIGYGFDDISDFSVSTRPGNRSVIDLGTGQKVYVAGMEADDFSNGDFLFFG